MATLAQLQTIRDNNLGDTCPSSPSAPLRDPICDRATFNALLSELYGTNYADNFSTTNVVTQLVTSTYTFYATKKGNTVFWNLYFQNSSGGTLANSDILSITNTEFQPKTGLVFYFSGINLSGSANEAIGLRIMTNKYVISPSLLNGQTASFSGTYQTND